MFGHFCFYINELNIIILRLLEKINTMKKEDIIEEISRLEEKLKLKDEFIQQQFAFYKHSKTDYGLFDLDELKTEELLEITTFANELLKKK